MISSLADVLVAPAPLRPRRRNTPRSSSVYDTASSSHQRQFNGWVPRATHSNPKVDVEASLEPYLPPVSSNRASSLSSDRQSKSSESCPGDTEPYSFPLASFSVPQLRSASQTSLRLVKPNPDVERILAKPSLLRTVPRPRTSSNTGNSSGSSASGDTSSQVNGRTTFYQNLTAKAEPLPRPMPGDSRRAMQPSALQERNNSQHREFDGAPSGLTPKAKNNLPRLSAVGYNSDDSEPSSCKLSIPAFYSNPKANSSDGTLDRKLSMDTLRTIDTMSLAIRSLGPASTPTFSIHQLPPSLSRRAVPSQRPASQEMSSGAVNRASTELVPTAPERAPREIPITSGKPIPDEVGEPRPARRTSKDKPPSHQPQDVGEFIRPRQISKDTSQAPTGRRASKDVSTKRSSQETPRASSKRMSRISNESSEATPRVSSNRNSRNGDSRAPNQARLSASIDSRNARRGSSGSSPATPLNEKRMETVQEEKKRVRRTSRSAIDKEAVKIKSEASSPSGNRTSFETALSTIEDVAIQVNVSTKDANNTSSLIVKPNLSKRRDQKIPAALMLGAPSPTVNKRLIRRHSRAASLNSLLSPAMSTISNVSTIAPIVGPRPPSDKELRRRRFLKLTRTLGEDIPPELLVTNCTGQQIRDSLFGTGREVRVEREKRRNSTSSPTIDPLLGALLLATPDEIMNDPELRFKVTGLPPRRPSSNVPEPGSNVRTSGYGLRDSNPNVLRKNNSLRKKMGVSLADSMGSNGHTEHDSSVHATPAPGPMAPIVATRIETISEPVPYFEDHPFRLVVEDVDGAAAPSPPAPFRAFTPDNPRITRDEIPWMRASMSLPLGDETPFLEYAVAMRQSPQQAQAQAHSARRRSAHLAIPDPVDATGIYRREKRQGWSGEWNQPHIQDVIEKLRNL